MQRIGCDDDAVVGIEAAGMPAGDVQVMTTIGRLRVVENEEDSIVGIEVQLIGYLQCIVVVVVVVVRVVVAVAEEDTVVVPAEEGSAEILTMNSSQLIGYLQSTMTAAAAAAAAVDTRKRMIASLLAQLIVIEKTVQQAVVEQCTSCVVMTSRYLCMQAVETLHKSMSGMVQALEVVVAQCRRTCVGTLHVRVQQRAPVGTACLAYVTATAHHCTAAA
jgi:hypothetical protein